MKNTHLKKAAAAGSCAAKKITICLSSFKFTIGVILLAIVTTLPACKKDNDTNATPDVEKNLVTFDTLDFKVFTGQQWLRMHESHADNIKVVMPDGTITTTLDVHIQNLQWLFSFAPDTRILQHPIRFGAGNYTAVTGIMEGTFSNTMYMPDGSAVPPNGKAYKISMCTIGIWKNGVMIEEQLFWDNRSFFKQLGL
jgi:hypothetical protein